MLNMSHAKIDISLILSRIDFKIGISREEIVCYLKKFILIFYHHSLIFYWFLKKVAALHVALELLRTQN